MALTTKVAGNDDLAEVERELGRLLRRIGTAANPDDGRIASFEARVASDWSRHLFLEQWGALAIAPGLKAALRKALFAWGLDAWPTLQGVEAFDEAFQVSIPALLAMQSGADVAPDGDRGSLADAARVKSYVSGRRRGLLGQASGHWRHLVEFNADSASVLGNVADRRGAFLKLVRGELAKLEVGSLGRRLPTQDIGHKRTALEFLYELHMNGWEHAGARSGVRVMRLAKHLYGGRENLVEKAGTFDELAGYIERQPAHGAINLVEASVSDFGPGILDGFLATDAGARHRTRDRGELLDALIHRRLSSKITDPNAGLGILNALRAAKAMYAFVSVRTGEFWLTMDGSATGEDARLRRRPGAFPPVVGTHWQLLYPDLTPDRGTG